MTTVGRWSPNKVRERVLNGTWASVEEPGGMTLVTPTSIASTGTSASIGANGSVTFTAVTSLSLNGVFSATYNNYMVVWRTVAGSATNYTIAVRLRASGTDASGANYVRQFAEADNTTVSATRYTGNTWGHWGNTSSTQRSGTTTHVYGPYLAQPTVFRAVNAWGRSSAYFLDVAGTHSVSTSYDGFTFVEVDSGGMSGVVSVYGLVGA